MDTTFPMRAAALLTLALAAGCGKDVAHYTAHPDERIAVLAECANAPGPLAATPSCVNAREAERRAMFSGTGMPRIR